MEMSFYGLLAEVDLCEYLYLRELTEPKDNELRLLIEEAGVAEPPSDVTVAGVTFASRPIESTDESRLFEIKWDQYIAYSVRNESYAVIDEYEIVEMGRRACLYTKSRFLDYVKKATFASENYPGPFRHIGINCLNHTIDVIATVTPTIRDLRGVNRR
jgi:hypothetical protein